MVSIQHGYKHLYTYLVTQPDDVVIRLLAEAYDSMKFSDRLKYDLSELLLVRYNEGLVVVNSNYSQRMVEHLCDVTNDRTKLVGKLAFGMESDINLSNLNTIIRNHKLKQL